MKIILKVKKGQREDRGKEFPFVGGEPDNITVGRAARKSERYGNRYPHVQLSRKDLWLSRWHFMLQLRPPNCYICDMGSTNHTYVNDFNNPIKGTVELKEGDIIKAGKTYLEVHITPEEPKELLKYTCVKCGKELKELEGKPIEDIKEADRICEACRFRWLEEEKKYRRIIEKKPPVRKKIIINCFRCGRDLTEQANKDGRAKELKNVALYFCKDCAFAEREKKEKIRDYLLLKELGGGGFGVVYLAWHKPTGRIVAIKELLLDKPNEKALKIFHREIEVTKELLHPNIVRFYDSFTRGRKPYLVTEYLPGGSAQDMLLRQEEPLPFDKACHIILEVLEGLSYAHKRGIVHRDVSLDNILFDNDGKAKLSDMGLAKSFEKAGQSGITTDETAGKLLYIAPDQILNYRFVKPPADVYSVGVCLYYLITGKFPYYFPSPLDVLLHIAELKDVKPPLQIILEDDPIPILERKPDLPKPLATVIDRCLRKRPEERFGDAGELKEEIEKALN